MHSLILAMQPISGVLPTTILMLGIDVSIIILAIYTVTTTIKGMGFLFDA